MMKKEEEPIVFKEGDEVLVCGLTDSSGPISTKTVVEKVYKTGHFTVKHVMRRWRQDGSCTVGRARIILPDSEEGRKMEERHKRWLLGRRLQALSTRWQAIPSKAQRLVIEIEKMMESR